MSFPFDAILFDCDGVLVDSEVVGLEDAAAYLSGHGFAWTTEDFIRRFSGMRYDRFAAGLREAYGQILGRDADEREFEELIDGLIETRRAKRHTMTLVTGTEDLLRMVQGLPGVRIAVASSSGQAFLDDKIDRYGLRPVFGQHVYSADHVSHGKPAPDIFLFAATRLGVAAERCLVIEDSAHGVAAGVAAEATVWGFTGGGHCLPDHAEALIDAGAERVFATHEQLTDEFTNLLSRREAAT
ncbi:HAD family hydrolase [Parvularcula dongshanensis]|uniref:Beta-phosphoglucomutase-like phosphatase (HAD superfamily) n=1 Tax=Parvularcula dongshanensis TaxID=1173995 RepID=A0A840I483_9PROT|nr:HAD family phosphatase [Parvularcula dongshanensis]MBB4659796.1 beta-phosphoglucomutase-like phosphatase (HAD superfamily) [Parvularcula dongshanensis]